VAKVLVVDDQMDACRAMARLLKHFGHDAACVGGCAEALAHLSKEIPDLLILDVMMPGMDGLDVLRVIRSDIRLQKLPVVMFSAVSDPKFREYAMSEGANDYWVKGSVDFSKLTERIEPLLARA
jgi:CheY-like chemotaxis protein